jgi:hypothetical protein
MAVIEVTFATDDHPRDTSEIEVIFYTAETLSKAFDIAILAAGSYLRTSRTGFDLESVHSIEVSSDVTRLFDSVSNRPSIFNE